jgi:16S rRNA (adenine1518-N6/adenine1519-N6)-dimethyltransferase
MEEYQIHPSRALGQNFLADPNTAERIVRLAGIEPGQPVVEIGPGLGSLTVALVAAGARVTAVELDRRLAAALGRELEPEGVRVFQADAVTLDWGPVLAPAGEWVLVANLPYNVATSLVLGLLERVAPITRMLVMVQKEVGQRLAARVGDPAYGAVSVKISYWATAALLGTVSPSVFVPRPKVDSALVSIQRRPAVAVDPAAVGYERLVQVVNAGFSQRRKMLRGALASAVTEEAFDRAGVKPTQRAEELDVAAWGRLARL